MKKDRIGIFGGTFNPIHNGHLKAARLVQKKFSLDRILFIPSFIPPHKESGSIAPALDRLKMVELAVRGRSRFIASALEIQAKGKSYSILTLNRIKKLYPGAWAFFILGVDAFLEIETWREWKRVLDQCFFIVVTRPGYRLREVPKALAAAYRLRFRPVSRFEEIREQWFARPRIFLLPIDAADISSTEVRRRVREGRTLRGYVPAAVEAYVRKRGLYQGQSTRHTKLPWVCPTGKRRDTRPGTWR
jgi:nicotinate-nucleotide adenylyltransferase